MRTLQRLRHVQIPSGGDERKIHSAERRRTQRRELQVWARRLRAAFRTLSFLGLIAAAGYWLWGGGFVAEALVEANLVVARAPATVKVAEVFVRAGERCQDGTPLVRLESTRSEEERRPLELAVTAAELRLRLLEAGGDLGDTDIARRAEALAEAEREWSSARSDSSVAGATLSRVRREREALALALRVRDVEDQGAAQALAARSEEAQARVARALEDGDLADLEARARTSLNDAGFASDLDVASATAEREAGLREVDELAAAARAVAVESSAAREVSELGREEAHAALAESDARLAEAEARVEAASERVELWSQAWQSRRALLPVDALAESERLRELELALAQAELELAHARLAEFDRISGAATLRAWTGGVIERVFAEAEAVIEAGEPLVRYFDPERLHVVAYLDPSDAHRPRVGQPCRILQPGGARLEGRVSSIDAALVPCPDALPRSQRGPTDLRLAVHIECDLFDQRALLQPNLRVRVAFTDGEEAVPARAGG